MNINKMSNSGIKVWGGRTTINGNSSALVIKNIMANTGNVVFETYNKFILFRNSRDWEDYKELLPAFAEHLGFKLIVEPDETKRLGRATSGNQIIIYEEWGTLGFYFGYFHEMAHNLMHFNKDGFAIDRNKAQMEAEADAFATFFCHQLFPEHKAKFSKLAKDNPVYNRNNE
jgi:hypothetical protein